MQCAILTNLVIARSALIPNGTGTSMKAMFSTVLASTTVSGNARIIVREHDLAEVKTQSKKSNKVV